MKTFLEWLEYNKPRDGMKSRWSICYKKSIDCSHPKGFSQKNYCRRKKRGGGYKSSSWCYYVYVDIGRADMVQVDIVNIKNSLCYLYDNRGGDLALT